MASKEQVAKLISTIKAVYPRAMKDTDIKLLAQIWNVKLQPYDDRLVGQALSKCLDICTFPPTPADLIQQINAFETMLEQPAEELWNVLVKNLRKVEDLVSNFNYTYVDDTGVSQGQQARNKANDLFEKLPDKLKTYLGGYGEFIRMSSYDDDSLKFEKNRFLKRLPEISKQQKFLLQNKENGFLLSD